MLRPKELAPNHIAIKWRAGILTQEARVQNLNTWPSSFTSTESYNFIFCVFHFNLNKLETTLSKNVPEVYYPNFLPPFSDGFQTLYLQIYISPKPFFENSYNSASHLKIPVALEVVHYNMLYLISSTFYCTLFHMYIFYSISEVINLKYFSLL